MDRVKTSFSVREKEVEQYARKQMEKRCYVACMKGMHV